MLREEMTSNLEDYLEMVYFLSPEGQGVHAATVADRLGVTRASVTGALRALAKRGYIRYTPYAPVLLTPEGVEAARACADRHHFLHSFLRDDLGMEDEAAEAAACKMEHAVSGDIVKRLAAYVERHRAGSVVRGSLPKAGS